MDWFDEMLISNSSKTFECAFSHLRLWDMLGKRNRSCERIYCAFNSTTLLHGEGAGWAKPSCLENLWSAHKQIEPRRCSLKALMVVSDNFNKISHGIYTSTGVILLPPNCLCLEPSLNVRCQHETRIAGV